MDSLSTQIKNVELEIVKVVNEISEVELKYDSEKDGKEKVYLNECFIIPIH